MAEDQAAEGEVYVYMDATSSFEEAGVSRSSNKLRFRV